ncbi:glutathione-disulfide reductase [Egbenema bharatensis]|uniref:glutathione-disulfide reductase n=1 Tax=Egbenema bharatensis TaxID=3463334 RepID=UPI003A8C5DA1
MHYTYDLLVIGGGSGGLAAAKRAAQHGVRVAIVEQKHWGGTCVNRGCIPKKLMVYASDVAHQVKLARSYGWQIQAEFNWSDFVQARDRELERLRQVHETSLSKAGVDRIQGHACFVDAHTVQVEDQTIQADKILIAVGGKPILPDIEGIEHTITSRDIFHLPRLPERLVIVGGGYIGVEFASMMRGFGCEVAILNRESCILPGFDGDLTQTLRDALRQRGINSLCDTTATAIQKGANGLELTLSGEESGSLVADVVLCAVGRSPNLEGLRLEQAEVEFSQKAIEVDDYYCTNQPNIYAIGDCSSRLPLTPVAIAEGHAVADTLFGGQRRQIEYDSIPSAVFARPEAAAVGMTESKAKEQFGDEQIICDRTEFRPLVYSLSESPEMTMMKFVIHKKTDRVLGLHIVGEHAAEMIQGAALAMQNGMTKQAFSNLIGIHPTSAEELFS